MLFVYWSINKKKPWFLATVNTQTFDIFNVLSINYQLGVTIELMLTKSVSPSEAGVVFTSYG